MGSRIAKQRTRVTYTGVCRYSSRKGGDCTRRFAFNRGGKLLKRIDQVLISSRQLTKRRKCSNAGKARKTRRRPDAAQWRKKPSRNYQWIKNFPSLLTGMLPKHYSSRDNNLLTLDAYGHNSNLSTQDNADFSSLPCGVAAKDSSISSRVTPAPS